MKKFVKYFILTLFTINIFSFASIAKAEEKKASWQQIFPDCIQQQMNSKAGEGFSKECDDVGVFVQLAINIGAYLFTFIGALALLVFVYGGFNMIISAGDSGKIKEGKDAMVAAVIGIVIAFSGVAIVRFLGDKLQLKSEYKINSFTDTEKNNSSGKIICCMLSKPVPSTEKEYVTNLTGSECLNNDGLFEEIETPLKCDENVFK